MINKKKGPHSAGILSKRFHLLLLPTLRLFLMLLHDVTEGRQITEPGVCERGGGCWLCGCECGCGCVCVGRSILTLDIAARRDGRTSNPGARCVCGWWLCECECGCRCESVWVDLCSHSALLHDVTEGRQITELDVWRGGGGVWM